MRSIIIVPSVLLAVLSTPVEATEETEALERLGRLLVLQETIYRNQKAYSSSRDDLGSGSAGGVRIETADGDGWRAVLDVAGGRWELAVNRGPSMTTVRDRIRADLRGLVPRQARFRGRNRVYAESPEELGLELKSTVRITANGRRGWLAEATRPLFVDRNCVIRVGAVEPRPETRRDGRTGYPGQVVCDRPPQGIYDRDRRKRAYREMGRALQHYLDRQQTALGETGGFMPEMEVRNPDGTIVRTVERPEPVRVRAVGAHEAIGRVTWELTLAFREKGGGGGD